MDIAGVTANAFRGLANVVLSPSAFDTSNPTKDKHTSFQLNCTPSPNLESSTVTPSGVGGN
jgi:hypothetical protein